MKKLIGLVWFGLVWFGNMQPALAAACQGTAVDACSNIKDETACAGYYIPGKPADFEHNQGAGLGMQCKWGGGCYDGGGTCE